jgi:hypothetical protein
MASPRESKLRRVALMAQLEIDSEDERHRQEQANLANQATTPKPVNQKAQESLIWRENRALRNSIWSASTLWLDR